MNYKHNYKRKRGGNRIKLNAIVLKRGAGNKIQLNPMILRRQSGKGRKNKKQRGGFLPLFLIPAAIAAGKAVAVGAASGAAAFAANKILTAATKK